MFLELEAIDRLLHERPLFTDAAINLFGQNLEALVADNRLPGVAAFAEAVEQRLDDIERAARLSRR